MPDRSRRIQSLFKPEAESTPMSDNHANHSRELEYYIQQMQVLEQEKSRFAMKRIEIEGTKKALSEILKAGDNSDIMIPIGSGVFLRGKVSDAKTATVSVGADVAVQKSIPDAEKFLSEQLTNLDKAILRLDGDISRIEKEARRISKEIEQAH